MGGVSLSSRINETDTKRSDDQQDFSRQQVELKEPKTFETIIKEMKALPAYSHWFVSKTVSQSTSQNPRRFTVK